uniref:Uncharacterized protein n=1 Tax=Anguilla anguilla TaxID=7936 RepID=A0A0E9SNP3_ANGAN
MQLMTGQKNTAQMFLASGGERVEKAETRLSTPRLALLTR